jgi:hypothetical protein
MAGPAGPRPEAPSIQFSSRETGGRSRPGFGTVACRELARTALDATKRPSPPLSWTNMSELPARPCSGKTVHIVITTVWLRSTGGTFGCGRKGHRRRLAATATWPQTEIGGGRSGKRTGPFTRKARSRKCEYPRLYAYFSCERPEVRYEP